MIRFCCKRIDLGHQSVITILGRGIGMFRNLGMGHDRLGRNKFRHGLGLGRFLRLTADRLISLHLTERCKAGQSLGRLVCSIPCSLCGRRLVGV